MTQIDQQKIHQQLDRIEASATFRQAGRLVGFLRYIVEATIAGEGSMLNQYSIAIDVMGRGSDFDPSTDSSVRVEAGRLRAKIREYYDLEGTGDAIRIQLPKGRYNPDINVVDDGLVEPSTLLQQTVRFCQTSDEVAIAYAVSGQDTAVLVKAANWLSHLEHDCSSPVWAHWWQELSHRFQLVRYDERGCGLSDW
jgi:hypothetical protein